MARDFSYGVNKNIENWSNEWNDFKASPFKKKSNVRPYTYHWNSYSNYDPFFHYHGEFIKKYNIPSSKIQKKTRMANVVPWLMTMSLLGVREFVEPAEQISQELEAPAMLPQLPSVDFAMPSTTSFDDPAFGQEEPPVHNCEFPRNHNPNNAIIQQHPHQHPPSTDKPHGFQIDPNFATMPSKKPETKKNERNIDTFQNGANTNAILQSFKGNHQNKLNESERFFVGGHTFKPPMETGFKDEYAGPAMQLAYFWKTVDFEFDSDEHRNSLLYSGTFIPENNLPLGLEVWKDKIFVSLPRWKKGIPVTLATISSKSMNKSPKLRPFPNWRWHHLGNCQLLTSVFRMQVDECDRLWVLDSGKIDITNEPKQICPPKIFVFDLHTDELIRSYAFPADQVKEDSLYSNIVVDVRNEQCDRAVAYASDVWRFGLVVYDFFNDSSFRVQHHTFFPDPLASRYNLHGLEFHWTDGLFGIALTPVDVNDEKTMFYHPMSSFREFAVPLSALKDKRMADLNVGKFVPVGKPRAKDYGHSSASAIDRDGVMFFNMVTRDSVWCWDTRKEYVPKNLGAIGTSSVSLVFPNDVRVDHEEDQNVWILSNKLPMYLYGYLNKNEVNFRILKANAKNAVRNTVCDPNYIVPESPSSYEEAC